MINDYEIFKILGLKQLKNIFSLSKPTMTQVDKLKIRYYQQTTFLDKLARFYGKQHEIFKLLLKYFSIGFSVLSFFCLGASASLGMIIFTALLFFLEEHYELMETRFSQLSEDLNASEKQLQQAFVQNADLESQLSSALQKNQEASDELGKIKEEVVRLREQILEKEQVIEKSKGVFSDSTHEIQSLVSEMRDMKTNLSERARQFSEQVVSTEKKMKGLFDKGAGESNKLKESRVFREQMDRYFEENLLNY